MGNDLTSLIIVLLVITGFLLLVFGLYKQAGRLKKEPKNNYLIRLLLSLVVVFFILLGCTSSYHEYNPFVRVDKSKYGPYVKEKPVFESIDIDKKIKFPARFFDKTRWLELHNKLLENDYRKNKKEFDELARETFDKMLVIGVEKANYKIRAAVIVDYKLNSGKSIIPSLSQADKFPYAGLRQFEDPVDGKLKLYRKTNFIEFYFRRPFPGAKFYTPERYVEKPFFVLPFRGKSNGKGYTGRGNFHNEFYNFLEKSSGKNLYIGHDGGCFIFVPFSSAEKMVDAQVNEVVFTVFPEKALKSFRYRPYSEKYKRSLPVELLTFAKGAAPVVILITVLIIFYFPVDNRKRTLKIPVGFFYISILVLVMFIGRDYIQMSKPLSVNRNAELYSDSRGDYYSNNRYRIASRTEFFRHVYKRECDKLLLEKENLEEKEIIRITKRLADYNFYPQFNPDSRRCDKNKFILNSFLLNGKLVNFYLLFEEINTTISRGHFMCYYYHEDIIAQVIARRIAQGEDYDNWLVNMKYLEVKPISKNYFNKPDYDDLGKELKQFDESFAGGE